MKFKLLFHQITINKRTAIKKTSTILSLFLFLFAFLLNAQNCNYELNELLAKADTAYTSRKNKSALEDYGNVMSCLKSNGMLASSDYFLVLKRMGSLYNRLEQFDESVKFLNQGLEWIEKFGDIESPDYGEILTNLTSSYRKNGEYKYALESGKKSVEILGRHKNDKPNSYQASLLTYAQVHWNMGNYSEAESILVKALEGFKEEDKSSEEYAGAVYFAGLLYYESSQFYKSIEKYEEVKSLLPESHGGHSAANNGLAMAYERLGEYDKALELNLRALDKTNPESARYGKRAQNIGFIYMSLGDYAKALDYFKQAHEKYAKYLKEDHPDIGELMNNIGKLYLKLEEYNEAEYYFKAALDNTLINVNENHPDYGYMINDFATALIELGRENEAIALMEENLFNSLDNDHNISEAFLQRQHNLAIAYNRLEMFEKALPLITNAVIHIKTFLGDDHEDLAKMNRTMAITFYGLNRPDDGFVHLKESNRIYLENVKKVFKFRTENEKKLFLRSLQKHFDLVQTLAFENQLELSEINSINLNNQLILKGLLLNNSRNVIEQLISVNDEEINARIKDYRNTKALIAQKVKSTPDSDDLIILRKKMNDLETDLVKLHASMFDIDNLTDKNWTEIQPHLKDSDLVIEFSRFEVSEDDNKNTTQYAAYLFSRNSKIPLMIPLCKEDELIAALKSGNLNNIYSLRGSRGKSLADHKAISDLVWKPISPYTKNAETIYLSPSGLLNQVAFSALTSDNGTVLLDSYKLVQLRSSSALKEEFFEYDIEDIVLIGGIDYGENIGSSIKTWDYLPGTLEEILDIQEIFDGEGKTAIPINGKSAAKDTIFQLSGRSPSIIHIATHGFYNRSKINTDKFIGNNSILMDDPLLRSGLVLSGANEDDDAILTAFEISNLDLSESNLIVLSACETGLGDIEGNEGVYGLQRAFKMAGVDSIIMSLWEVPDRETAEFMKLFYSVWIQKKNIYQSFRESLLMMHKKYPDEPVKWAGFVLVK